MTVNTQLKYAVIGAGPCGLAAARNLQRFGVDFIGFEKHSNVGGLWDIDNPHSTMYESAHLISSKTMTEFHEFPMKPETPDYPSHRHLCEYFRDYAEKFDLKKHFIFNATIEKVTRTADGNWEVQYNGKTMKVAGVIIATGTLHYPNLPSYPGKFTGEIIHSGQYKSADIFRNKRVLIVGAGNSGCDIAVDAVYNATKVDMSLRRGYHFVPKYIFGRPADIVGKVKVPTVIKKAVQKQILKLVMGDATRLGFPKPDHKLFESHPIVNSLVLYHAGHGNLKIQKNIKNFEGKTVHFEDGHSAEYDLIVYSTGYKLKFPFIDEKELNWKGACPDLYLNIFHPEYNNLFVIGMVEALGIGWQGRFEQAELIAKFIKNLQTKPESTKTFIHNKKNKKVDLSGGMNYIKLDRMSYYVNKDVYLEQIRKENHALN
ncbi:MAG: NAD(P)-binding domain-containing protein [Bacteriovoracaceae bacterium]|nr:NAD(P)-binding domain-containing protein [Bacteriovoracaceae bacterium]